MHSIWHLIRNIFFLINTYLNFPLGGLDIYIRTTVDEKSMDGFDFHFKVKIKKDLLLMIILE